jgi:CHAT domain-containing protein
MGFTRALLGAGVKSVLMTLWKVEELPTRIFIEEFYQSWQTGRSRSAAVTAAQQALRAITEQQLRARLTTYGISPTVVQDELARFALRQAGEQPFVHPYYWAGFVLVGDPT